MSTFPLLRLPLVPVRKILKLWNPIEIVEFSFCSKKTYTIAKKNLNKSKQLSLAIHEFDRRRIEIWFFENSFEIAISKHEGHIPEGSYDAVINKHSLNIAPDTNKPNLITYWEDENIGLNELIKYIADIFNYPALESFRLDTSHKNLSLLHWINQQYPGNVEQFFIETNNEDASDADVKLLLDSCKFSKMVLFTSTPSPSFQYEFNFYMVEWLALQSVKWITLDHLIVLTNQVTYLILADTSISNKDVNTFLLEWVSGESVLKTKHIMVRGEKVNIDEIFMGIEREEEDPDYINSLRKPLGAFPNVIQKGFNIYRENGVEALVVTQETDTSVLVEICIRSDYPISA